MIFVLYQNVLFGENPYHLFYLCSSFPMHCHDEIEIYYCLRGKAKIIIDENEYSLTKGCILFVSSLAMHQIIIEDENAAVFVLEFGSQLIGQQFNEMLSKKFTHAFISPDEDISFRRKILIPIQKLYYEFTEKPEGYHYAIRGLFFELYAMILRYIPMQQQKLKNLDNYLKIQNIFELVQNEYSSDITLKQAAEYIGYHPTAFCRYFKEITGTTFHDYLNAYRINMAMRLLEQKTYSVNEIGTFVGIPDSKNLTRVFKKIVGMTPTEYKKKYFKNIEEK